MIRYVSLMIDRVERLKLHKSVSIFRTYIDYLIYIIEFLIHETIPPPNRSPAPHTHPTPITHLKYLL